jgi:hypothetical protein
MRSPVHLPEFNFTYYYNSLLEGYRGFMYLSFRTYGVLIPARRPWEGTNSYYLSFDDFEVLEMACGIDEFKIYFNANVLP